MSAPPRAKKKKKKRKDSPPPLTPKNPLAKFALKNLNFSPKNKRCILVNKKVCNGIYKIDNSQESFLKKVFFFFFGQSVQYIVLLYIVHFL